MDDNISSTVESNSEYTPYAQRPETYIVPVLFFIIFVVGVLGNGTLVIIFLRHRAMRNVPNTDTINVVETEECPIIKGVLYQLWYPFDTTKYFALVLINDWFFFFLVIYFTFYFRLLLVSLMLFILSQIHILTHMLMQLEETAKRMEVAGNINHEVIFKTAKECVMKHQEIIKYIFSLALADLLVIVTCVPFTSIIYTVDSWPWGALLCKINETVKDISIGVSVFTLTALSAERYCAIVNPLRRLQTKPLTVISAGMIWLLATGFALPDAVCSRLTYIEVNVNKTITVCIPFPNITDIKTYIQYAVVIKSLIYYFIPLTIIGCFYILMAIRLHRSANEMPGEIRGTQSVAQARARRHVARMVLIFVFLFFICFLPHHAFMLWFHLYPGAEDEYNDWWHALKIIGFCLSFLNSCVNPVALYCVSGVFRGHFNRYLCCQDPRWPRNTLSAANCETSFNSTYRRHTQNTMVENQSIYRKNTIARKNMEDTNCLDSQNPDLLNVGMKNIMLRSQMEMDHGGYCS